MSESRNELKPLKMTPTIRFDHYRDIELAEEKKKGSGFTLFVNYAAGSWAQNTKSADQLTREDYKKFLEQMKATKKEQEKYVEESKSPFLSRP